MLVQKNPHLSSKEDFWYHLGFGPSEEVKGMFKDVKVFTQTFLPHNQSFFSSRGFIF